MKCFGIQIPIEGVKIIIFFEMTGKSDQIVNVYNKVYNWYMKLDWYTKPYTAFLFVDGVSIY